MRYSRKGARHAEISPEHQFHWSVRHFGCCCCGRSGSGLRRHEATPNQGLSTVEPDDEYVIWSTGLDSAMTYYLCAIMGAAAAATQLALVAAAERISACIE